MEFLKELQEQAEKIRIQAVDEQICKRKAVGCAIVEYVDDGEFFITSAINGPSNSLNECTNEVGNCGCSHAEPRAIVKYLKHREKEGFVILYTTYSPCVPCANLIMESGIIDAVVYDIFAEHWSRADKMLRRVMPVGYLGELTTEDLQKWISLKR